MMKPLRYNRGNRAAQLGEFAPYTHPLIKFIWQQIIDRQLNLGSVADSAGVDPSTLHKWRRAKKGPYLLQLDEVLSVLGYELTVVRKVELDE